MITTTYTFPTQQIIAGDLSFEVGVCDGNWDVVDSPSAYSASVSDKYFSSDIKISNETEFLGGDLQSAFCDITIDDDTNDFFSNTILPTALTLRGFVTIKILLDTDVIFYGAVEPSTINREIYFSSNDSFDGSKSKLSFRCTWIFNVLKKVEKSAINAPLASVATDSDKIVYYSTDLIPTKEIVAGSTIRQIINACLGILNTRYGYTINVSYELVNYTMFSKEGADDTVISTEYNYPVHSIGGSGIGMGDIDYVNILDSYLIRYDQILSDLAGFFSSADDKILTVYDFLSSIIKSLGLVCTINHTGVDFNIVIGDRVSSGVARIEDIMTAEITPLLGVARSGADISSVTSGNSFKKDFDSIGSSDFSLQTTIDFGNDYDFCGTDNPVNSVFSLAYPVQNPLPVYISGVNFARPHFALLRYAGVGENKLSNYNFGDGLTGWTQSSGSWDVLVSPFAPFFPNTYARVAMGSTDEKELQQTLSAVLDGRNGSYILSGRFFKSFAGGTVALKLKFYAEDGSLAYYETKTIATTNERLHYAVKVPFNILNISKIGISVTPSIAFTPSDYFYIRGLQLFDVRKGTPDIVGKTIEQYFNGEYLSNLSISMSGIKRYVLPRSWFYRNGKRYFIKGIELDISENESNATAINYPY